LSTSSSHLSILIQCNINTLAAAINVIKQLPADQYTQVNSPYFESCLGKHFRHILDHYLCFERDLEKGVIDYDQRKRSRRLEADKDYALTLIGQTITFLAGMKEHADKPLQVILCNDISLPTGELTDSTVRRELQFLQGHTVHHYASIAIMLRFLGIEVPRDFGIAPSTLVHETTMKVSA
jgi:uncharacterized damage-inducible protein DinB